MNKLNYQKMMEQEIAQLTTVPTLLLHSCCGPCSTYCIKTLAEHFAVTVFYYNPNIYPEEEYILRAAEQKRFIEEFQKKEAVKHPVTFVEGDFVPADFYEKVKGYEDCDEGGERCFLCYELRLEESAKYACAHGFDYLTTTLSISPLKNAEKLNEIGTLIAEKYHIKYLYSDFKKKEGYKQSAEISREYGMFRQYYCGCVFSKKERDEQIAAQENLKSNE